MSIERTCAFTGNRDMGDGIEKDIVIEIVEAVIEKGVDTFLCGMARGFDLLAAEAVADVKKRHRKIKLIACVPCPDQDKYFNDEDKKKYKRMLKKCDEVRVLSTHYYNGCMQMRDRYMVDESCMLIAYCYEKKGGTHYTLTYAVDKNKTIYQL